MRRSLLPCILILCLGIALFGPALDPAQAQTPPDARTVGQLNLRSGPGQTYTVITRLAPDTGLLLEARSEDAAWLLGHTPGGQFRGWIARQFVTLRQGFDAAALPLSSEIVRGVAYEAVDLADGADLIHARAAAIDPHAYPVIPAHMGRAPQLYRRALAAGRDPGVISKVGDCNTAGWVFLFPFGEGRYTLGDYGDLQGVIDHFAESLAWRTFAAHNGLNASAVLDPLWADPAHCQPGESSLACEYRLHNPAFAIIMFGTNDLLSLNSDQFDHALRRVISATIEADIVPILSTFPLHLALPERAITFNQIVIRAALDYNIPLINLWRALEPLPNFGIAPDGFHLSGPQTFAGDLTDPNLQTGFPRRNLVTLQGLDAVWRAARGAS
ncbi:MAG: hypothetical protein GXY36_06390 [Chloroflexi bacterium]|nr:hypothetical protein [Chloroflexota bacterium]